ncbi:MAG: cytochrome c oxidase assembly protein [Dehalococcoidia bacterium]|nr:cytochrome c oxidase assembly protein [Dehalococcoidia bacterium]
MSIGWWPAASDAPWTWGWHGYLGVWVIVAAVGGVVALEWRRASRARGLPDPQARQRRWCALAGVALLWTALDWPLGALASVLLSAAAVQYLVLSLAVAPLLLYGLPRLPQAPRHASVGGLWRPPVQLLTGAAFAAVLLGGSATVVVDRLRPSEAGSMLLGVLWLAAAVALWWPVLRRDGRQLRYMAAVAYLFVPFILPKLPGLVYILESRPVYEVYAAAPRVAGLTMTAVGDQRLAGAILWSAGTVLVFVSLGLLFAAWYRDERRVTQPASLQVPADPELVAELFTIPGAWTALERVIEGLEASLPLERQGVELRIAVREVASARRVVVELHAPFDDESSAVVSAHMTRDLRRYLAGLSGEQRAAIEAHLGFEVVSFRPRPH